MREIDRVFLQDYCRFGFLNHVISATALAEAYRADAATEKRIHRAVARLLGQYSLDSPGGVRESFRSRLSKKIFAEASARRIVAGSREKQRIQKICVARLFAEEMATVEDIGALCWAVQHRDDAGGIFKGYLDSKTRDVGAFFQAVTATTADEEITQLLRFPGREAIRERLASEMSASALATYESNYDEFPAGLRRVAEQYRSPSLPEIRAQLTPSGRWAPDGGPPLDPAQSAKVVVEVSLPGEPEQDRRGLFVRAFNKIKHRFAVVETVDELVHAPGNEWAVYSIDMPITPEIVNHLLTQISALAISAGYGLAYHVLLFDELGLLP